MVGDEDQRASRALLTEQRTGEDFPFDLRRHEQCEIAGPLGALAEQHFVPRGPTQQVLEACGSAGSAGRRLERPRIWLAHGDRVERLMLRVDPPHKQAGQREMPR